MSTAAKPKSFHLADEFTDLETERGLIAAITVSPELYFQLVDLLPRGTFPHEAEAWDKLSAAVEAEQPPGPCGWTPAPDPAAAAARLADLFQRRLMVEAWERRIAPALYDLARPAGEVISLLETETAGVQAAVREFSAGQAQALPELFKGIMVMLQKNWEAYQEHGKATVGVSTGIPKLDKLLGGLQPGLHLLAAEPGAGKTTLACNIAADAAMQGCPVLFVTFEETPERLALKVICGVAGLNQKLYVEGIADPGRVAQAIATYTPSLRSFKMIEGTARLTVPMLKAKALAAMAHHKADRCLIVIDYLQKWAASRREFNDFRHIIGGLVAELRELSTRLDSPVLAISSQNRGGQGEAYLTSLKESGDLEYSADTASFLVSNSKRGAIAPNRAVDLKIMKNRYGDLGTVPLLFQPDVCRMGEAAFDE